MVGQNHWEVFEEDHVIDQYEKYSNATAEQQKQHPKTM